MPRHPRLPGWWEPVEDSPSPRLHGKVESEPSRAGGTEIALLVKGLDLPGGAEVDVVCDGTIVLRATVTSGSVRRTVTSAEGHADATDTDGAGTGLRRT